MTWVSRSQPVQVGDTVSISERFLRSINCCTGDMPDARGTVQELKQVGEMTVAVVDWGNWQIEAKVNARNLSGVSERGLSG